MKIFILIIFYILMFTSVNAQQNNYAIGGGIGIGSLMGDFPSQTTLGGKIFIETNNAFNPFDKLRLHFTYAKKIEKFLPGNFRIQYYSFMYSIGFSGLLTQELNQYITIKEGIGLILLNDRSFNDINVWNYGVSLSLLGEINLNKNISLGLGLDYGLTLSNTNVSYFLLTLQSKYYIEL